jgi:hypothetical protein
MISLINQDNLAERLSRLARPISWVGALSFEERCLASLARLDNLRLAVDEILLLEYNTTVVTREEERRRREKHYSLIWDCATRLSKNPLQRRETFAYSFDDIKLVLSEARGIRQSGSLIVDITCMTKIHALAVAVFVQGNPDTRSNCLISYSSPENYGDLERSHEKFGWSDVLIAPLGDAPSMTDDADSRGIIIPGHESDRLLMAISEVEPAGGTIVVVDSHRRPDMRKLCEKKNEMVVKYLIKMHSSDWSKEVVMHDDFVTLSRIVEKTVNEAASNRAPVFLLPFGPKGIIFVTTYELATKYVDATWFVYPVPTAYDVNYTEGVRSTRWLSVVDA